MAATALFHGRRFYLTRAMAPQQRQRVRELIEERGGEVTADLRGAIQLVGPEHLDPRQEWVSIDFVLDSVARGALQDLSDYMGQELEPASPPREQAQQSVQSPEQAAHSRRQKRVKYSAEDDARMLVFLQSNFGGFNKSMMSVPLSVWETAARKKVTNHSGQSMHERYRKQLRPKTPSERREIISKGLKRPQAGGNEEDENEEEVEEIDEDYESGNREAGANPVPSTATTPATTTQAPPAAAAAEEQTPTPPVAQSPRDKTPPLRVSKRAPARRHIDSSSEEEEKEEEEEEEEEESESESRGRKRLRRSTPEKEPASADAVQPATALQSTDALSLKLRLRSQSSPMLAVGRPPLHREPTRHQTIGVATRSSTRGVGITMSVAPPRSSSSEEEEEKEGGEEKEEEKGGEEQQRQVDAPTQAIESGGARVERGVVFSSVWATAIADRANQRRLHDLFEPSAESTTAHLADSPAESSPPVSPRAARGQANEASPVPTQALPASPSIAAATSERQHGSPGSDATSTPQTTRKRSLSDAGDEQQTLESPAEVEGASPRSEPAVELEVEHSTEQELDAQLARISFETNASQQAILHALYYSSGSYATATAFLQGRSPVGMWSPQDDLLLASLTRERTTAADVKAAARAGAFASMRVQRSAADILARIRYLL